MSFEFRMAEAHLTKTFKFVIFEFISLVVGLIDYGEVVDAGTFSVRRGNFRE
jgi:hypothetical protein